MFVLSVALFNFNKFKVVDVFSNNKKYVYVLGDVIGIKATTEGVLVLEDENELEYVDKLKKGDRILYINDQKADSSKDVYSILNQLKCNVVDVTFERDGEIITKSIKTKNQNGVYRLGFWVRDKISGIGTMTCYDPDKNLFYAIGHPICDSDTRQILKINRGDIYNLSSLEVLKSEDGVVGQIKGDFDLKNIVGCFKQNSRYGIEGVLSDIDRDKRMQVADFDEIKLGKAQVLFKSPDKSVKYYDILIENIDKQSKTLEIEIVDSDLIDYTGGIIQGMSGTPIIQDDKLIGSITYVLKNNPKKGFGIFIGEMIK